MSAAVTESHSSWPARASRTSVAIAPAPASSAVRRAVGVAELAREQLGQHAAERAALGDLRDQLGGGVPEHDAAVGIGGDDRVGDAPEDRRDAVLLARRPPRRGARCGAPPRPSSRTPRAPRPRRRAGAAGAGRRSPACPARRRRRSRSARRPSSRSRPRSTGSSGASRPSAARSSSATGREVASTSAASTSLTGSRSPPRLSTGAPSAARRTSSSSSSRRRAQASAPSRLTACATICAQHRARVEVGREQGADALQLARRRARAALGLLQLHALDGGGRRHAQALGERHVGVVELARAPPQQRDDAGGGARALVRDRHGQQRGARHAAALLGRDARVAAEAARGDDAALAQRQQLEADRRRARARRARPRARPRGARGPRRRPASGAPRARATRAARRCCGPWRARR